MTTAIQLFGSGKFFAGTGSGSPGDPFIPALSGDAPVAAVPIFGSGKYVGVASGSGLESDPYVLAVAMQQLDSDDGAITSDGSGNVTAASFLSAAAQPADFAGVPTVTTTGITDTVALAAIAALCAALGIATE
ncbi:MAG TPA: hypothetical protein VHX65_16870 [Pirellulales bacterium]|jgi:hypothetical protein|nr:hypothetical protein [Pirellulales bacterium]